MEEGADYFLNKSTEFERLVEIVEQFPISSQDTSNNPG